MKVTYAAVKAELQGTLNNHSWSYHCGVQVQNRTDVHRRGLAMDHGEDSFHIAVIADGVLMHVTDAYFRVAEDFSVAMRRELANKLGVTFVSDDVKGAALKREALAIAQKVGA